MRVSKIVKHFAEADLLYIPLAYRHAYKRGLSRVDVNHKTGRWFVNRIRC